MKRKIFKTKRIFLPVLWILIAGMANGQSYTSYVDPYIGSGGIGNVFIGASVPFGAVQLGPENIYKGGGWCSGYKYGDSILIGFAHTHLNGTGIGDLADILVMPTTGPVKVDKGTQQNPGSGFASLYDHKTEKVRPGYYAVKLDRYNIDVELTATERVGFHQYHFPSGKEGHVIIDLKEGINDQSTDTYIQQVDKYTLEGYRFSKGWAKNQWIFFAVLSSEPIQRFNVYDDTSPLPGDSARGKAIKGVISFDNAPSTLKLKVGISPVSSENALANIEAEIPLWDFQKVVKDADDKRNKELSKISIETKNESYKRVFYTSAYHTMIDPAIFNDHNGDYRGSDKKVYKNAPFTNYTVFSIWDTYRAANPLYILTQPERNGDIINSMVAIYQQSGHLPIWHLMGNETGTMVGFGSIQIIAEAYLKGQKGFDVNAAYLAAKNTAMSDTLGLKYDRDFKVIPSDVERRSVGRGLEYGISTGSLALMAKDLGKKDDYNYFSKRAQNYKLYYDPSTRFFWGKQADESPTPNFSPMRFNNNVYAEGNAWQYLWLAPQDIKGLISLLGGEEIFKQRLDSVFSQETDKSFRGLAIPKGTLGQYDQGNEPSHHIVYLYAYIGEQWKTAEKVRYILREMYTDKMDGIIGNDDCGQMSAWYIFSSMGFYPVYPASTAYVIGGPLFDKATITLPHGKKFVVEAINNSPENAYVQNIELNGEKYMKSYILHKDIASGGLLKITMGNKPNFDFGKKKEDRP
jgi:predicted alpha-1,2-mannosidase